MKKTIHFIVIISLVLTFSCKEEDQLILLDPSQEPLFDTSYVSTTPILSVLKNVLIEEFSGVRCPNCPKGNAKTEEIHALDPDRVNIITVHSDFLAEPFSGDQDLRCENADEIVTSYGPLSGKPSTLINRTKIYGDQTKFIMGGAGSAELNLWKTYSSQELLLNSPANIKLDVIFLDLEKRKFRFKTTIEFSEAVTDVYLGFILTESDIETKQIDVSEEVEYVQEFVLRNFLSSILGEKINQEITPNTVIIKEFEIDLNEIESDEFSNPEKWNINNLELTSFLRTDNDGIIQSKQIEL